MVSIDFAKFIDVFFKMLQKPEKTPIFCKSKKNKLQKLGIFGNFLTTEEKGSIIKKVWLPSAMMRLAADVAPGFE